MRNLEIGTIRRDNNNKSQYLQTPVGISTFNFLPMSTLTSLSKIKCNDSQFGAFINGSWTGMIGDVIKGAADIALGRVMMRNLSDYVNFSPELYPIQFDVIHRKLEQHGWDYRFYLQPLHVEIWLCVFAISLIVILVKILVNNVVSKNNLACCVLNFFNDLLLCWPIVLQDTFKNFSLKSMKFVFGIYVTFSMLLLMSYTSILTSYLATTDVMIPFSSLEEMLEKTNFLPVILKGAKFEVLFQNPPYENKRVIRADSIIQAVDLISNGKMAFLGPMMPVQLLIRGNCSFDVAPERISRDSVTIAYSKNFAYVDYFNFKILLLKQCGISSVEYKRVTSAIFSDWLRCPQSLFNPVSFSRIIGPFLVLMSGLLISLVVGIFELIIHKFTMM
uniref:Ionotropic glutamate receptor C-terminal domain-containing protein n=1 Tax=Strigamia maritima TaxID=126957 RepID=T1JIF5_STRMM